MMLQLQMLLHLHLSVMLHLSTMLHLPFNVAAVEVFNLSVAGVAVINAVAVALITD